MLLCLFVRAVRIASLTELAQFEAFFHGFFVFVRAVPNGLTLGALQLDHVILRHRQFLQRKYRG